jgi:hypothetical protein
VVKVLSPFDIVTPSPVVQYDVFDKILSDVIENEHEFPLVRVIVLHLHLSIMWFFAMLITHDLNLDFSESKVLNFVKTLIMTSEISSSTS